MTLADELHARLLAELEAVKLPPEHVLVVAHGVTVLDELPMPLVSVGNAPLPLPVSVGDAARWVEANAAELAVELAEQIGKAAAVLVAPKLRKAALQRVERLALWPWPSGSRFVLPFALSRTRSWWPGDAAPADVARWLREALNGLDVGSRATGDDIQRYVERGGLVLDTGWTNDDGTVVELSGAGAALLFLAERDVEEARRRPAIRWDAGKPHHELIRGLTDMGRALRGAAEVDVPTKDGRAELLLPGRSVQLSLDMPLGEALPVGLREALGPKGLQHWAGFQAQLSEQGGTGRLVWSLDRHLEVMGYTAGRRRNPKTRREAAAEAELFTALELAVYDKDGVERHRRPLFHKTNTVDKLEDGDWVTSRIELQINEAVYGGVRDFKTGKLGSNWYPVPPALARISHSRYAPALGLGSMLPIRFRLAWKENERTWLRLSGRNALQMGAIKYRKRDDRAWRQLERNLDELVNRELLERWKWTRNPETLDGMIELHAARWLAERTVLEVPVVEAMAQPQLKTGAELRDWRKGLGLTQKQAAERLGVSVRTVKSAEANRDGRLPRSIEKALRPAPPEIPKGKKRSLPGE